MAVVFLSRLEPDEARRWLGLLREQTPGERLVDAQELGRGLAGAEVDVAIVADPAPGALSDFPNLAFVQSAWAGVDALLADPTVPRDVPLARLVDPALGEAMAEVALTHVLAMHRGLPLYREQQAAGVWRQHPQPLAAERTVGILGLGEMGRRSAARLVDAGFRVRGWSRGGAALDGVEVFAGPAGLEPFLGGVDILVNLLPLTEETRGLLGAQAFAVMPPGASLINLGRGGHVVTGDLIAALDHGRLSHAVLDVFEREPLPPESPLWGHPRVTVTPHVAAITDPRSAARRMAENIARFRSGKPVEGLVSRDAGY